MLFKFCVSSAISSFWPSISACEAVILNSRASIESITFLRRTSILLFLISSESEKIVDQYNILLNELKKYNPELVLDFATLTGAAARAIGEDGVCFMGTANKKVKSDLEKSGFNVYERLVEFPLWREFGEQMKSNIADLKNLGGPAAGMITVILGAIISLDDGSGRAIVIRGLRSCRVLFREVFRQIRPT